MIGVLSGSAPLSAGASVDGYVEQQPELPSVLCASELEGEQPDDLLATASLTFSNFHGEQIKLSLCSAYSIANYLAYQTRAPPQLL